MKANRFWKKVLYRNPVRAIPSGSAVVKEAKVAEPKGRTV